MIASEPRWSNAPVTAVAPVRRYSRSTAATYCAQDSSMSVATA
jgi:hypothetical protein